ncbi:DUF4189 domain-containing protein [Stenotrophomonas sp. S48]|nr:DUF4189 domain-containing protein [Stenotrophomonas sp. S48]MBK0047403.1 DUF4189 domain-containing protein [Stenotrophomonas sp. S49]
MSIRIVRFATIPVFCFAAFLAYAEGGCPPGMYPIGGQGVQGCAPIPGAQGGGVRAPSTTPVPPRPLGEWIKTWGALARPSKGNMGGAVANELTEAAARRKAVENCEQNGGGECKVDFVYQNQCVSAVSSPELTSRGTNYVSAATEDEAIKVALQDCRKAGGTQCQSIYSACSVPFFRKY